MVVSSSPIIFTRSPHPVPVIKIPRGSTVRSGDLAGGCVHSGPITGVAEDKCTPSKVAVSTQFCFWVAHTYH